MTKVLECYNLSKKIKDKTIIDNVTFDVKKGEIVGFIGPNGAGKTTIIKMILGLSKIDKGFVLINNYSIDEYYKDAIRNVGAIIESPDLYSYLTGYQNLSLLARIYKLSAKDIDNVVSLVGLNDSIYNKVSTYSLGMRQRLGIGAALIHNPELIILDEPLNGLDPKGIKDIRELLIKLAREEGKAILISSHILSELETFCNKICLLKNGKLVYSDKVIKNNYKEGKYLFRVSNSNLVKKINNQIEIKDENNFTITLTLEEIPNLIKKIVNNNIDIYEVKEEKESLEDIYFKKAGDSNG
jgi:ABC-2 type transport system ATP-binding protein